MKVWVCIPVFNRIEYTLKCLASLQAQTYRDFCVVVCDHGSTDGTSEKIKAHYPDVVLLRESSDLWWTGAINCCVEYVLGAGCQDYDVIVTLNNDVEVDIDYLSSLVNAAMHHPHSVIASAGYDIRTRQLVDPGSRQNWFTAKVSTLDVGEVRSSDVTGVVEVTHAPGRGTLIPLQAFHELGLYDEKHLPHYGADYDFTFRARRSGYQIFISYNARVYSHVEATGMPVVRQNFGTKGFIRYLTDIKSPANLSARWWLAVNNCPRLLLPSFLLLDYFYVIGSYFKFHILRRIPARWKAHE